MSDRDERMEAAAGLVEKGVGMAVNEGGGRVVVPMGANKGDIAPRGEETLFTPGAVTSAAGGPLGGEDVLLVGDVSGRCSSRGTDQRSVEN